MAYTLHVCAASRWVCDHSPNQSAQSPEPKSPNGEFVIRVDLSQPNRATTTRLDEHKKPSPTDTRPAYAVPNAVTAEPPPIFGQAPSAGYRPVHLVRSSGLGSTQDIPCLALRARRPESPEPVQVQPDTVGCRLRDCPRRCFWSTTQ